MTSFRRPAVLSPLAAACAAVALGGTSAAAVAAKLPAACTVLRPADIVATLHTKVGACAEGDLGSQNGATWRTPNGERVVVQVRLTRQDAAQQFSAFTGLAKGVKVAGVGQKAFYETARARFHVLAHSVYVQLDVPPKTSLAAATKLAKLLAGRIR